ncbi:histidine N-acetyltransferase-like [Ambystoma mexicanum]|uniref:histidine N-acetyltransferase-like n=1 Tax=Ambystoma mexicanum TaxID=8296 RepID=UPI0037E886BC
MADHKSGKDTALDFCLATGEDFEGVMAISGDVYGGMDYLPQQYHRWMQDPNRRTFVAKREGQVVALESVLVVDDGQTAVGQGLRVAPWERGRNVAGLIRSFVEDFLKSEFPAVKIFRVTRIENPPPGLLSKYRLLHSKERGQGAALVLTVTPGEVPEIVHSLNSRLDKEGLCFQPPVNLGADDVSRIYQNESVIEKLLPATMLIQSWLPVHPKRSNLDYLLTQGITWLADKVEDPNFLSLGSPPFRVPLEENSFQLDIDLFGTDPRSAKMHFLAQLLAATEAMKEGVVFCSLYMELALFPVLDVFTEGIKRYNLWKEQLVMEKEL